MKFITSSRNPLILDIRRLEKGNKRQRKGLILVEGLKEIESALAGKVKIDTLVLTMDVLSAPSSERIEKIAESSNDVVSVSGNIFKTISFRGDNSGIIAVAGLPERNLNKLEPKGMKLILVAEGLEKPGNLGALFRTADGAGADCVLIADSAAEIFSRQAIRTSLGTIFTVPSAGASSMEIVTFLKKNNIRIISTSPDAKKVYMDADYSAPCAIAIGSEKDGLSSIIMNASDEKIRIPMKGTADSLNASVSAGIVLYEAASRLVSRELQ